jgi:hypothetical protein
MISHGCTLKKLKVELMKYYNKSVTDLDKGYGIPKTVYCVKPHFQFRGEWLPQDHCKIGKSHSLYNRTRAYCQQGSNVSALWSIDTIDPNSLEKEVHRYLADYHDRNALRTELFLLDCDTAYTVLDRMIEDLDLNKRDDIIAINRFSPNGLDYMTSSAVIQKDVFNDLFDFA